MQTKKEENATHSTKSTNVGASTSQPPDKCQRKEVRCRHTLGAKFQLFQKTLRPLLMTGVDLVGLPRCFQMNGVNLPCCQEMTTYPAMLAAPGLDLGAHHRTPNTHVMKIKETMRTGMSMNLPRTAHKAPCDAYRHLCLSSQPPQSTQNVKHRLQLTHTRSSKASRFVSVSATYFQVLPSARARNAL